MSLQKLFNQKFNIKLYCTGIKHVGDKTQKELSNSKITYTSDAIYNVCEVRKKKLKCKNRNPIERPS